MTARAVLKAVDEFGRAVRQLHRAQEQVDQIEEDWLDATRWIASQFNDDHPDQDDEDLKEARLRVLWEADLSGLPDELDLDTDGLLRERPAVELERCLAAVKTAEELVAGPHTAMVENLRAWLAHNKQATDDGRGKLGGEWPRILTAWRKSVDLTAREAASMLEVSPSAIVRYEQGTRVPSPPYIAAMIDRIDAVGSAARDSQKRKVLRAIAAMSGRPGEPTGVLEQMFQDQDEADRALLEQVEHRLEKLSTEELHAVAAVINNPEAVQALAALGGSLDLGPLQTLVLALKAEATP